jgi:hypothetical protein
MSTLYQNQETRVNRNKLLDFVLVMPAFLVIPPFLSIEGRSDVATQREVCFGSQSNGFE